MTPGSKITIDKIDYYWIECIEDFNGDWKSPGCSADIWADKNGNQIVRLLGGWDYYTNIEDFPSTLFGEKAQKAIEIIRGEKNTMKRLAALAK